MANPRNKRRQVKAPATDAQNIRTPQAGAAPDLPGAKVHSFSRTVAKEHGEKAAVLLQYLAHHAPRFQNLGCGRAVVQEEVEVRVGDTDG